ncbi:MAG: winged helix-turn-helix transcriptional regulator [Chloroflexi bacterium]|nr:winged helix-turn-helix transcriptional regulator [Chloroflexota bacterium]
MRRTGNAALTPGLLHAADLTLDRARLEVQRPSAEPVRLAPLEMRLLEALMLNAGQVLTAESLITTIWGAEGGDRTMLKQLVYRLRAKLEPNPAQPRYIETVPGVGYALAG